jgi:hypothetical protein
MGRKPRLARSEKSTEVNMKRTALSLIVPVIVLLVCGSTGGQTMKTEKGNLSSTTDLPEAAWQKLGQKKIYFGHQSVGDNIMDGVSRLMESNSHIKLKIVETNDPTAFKEPVFAHSSIGKNDDPDSKIMAFRNYMEKGIGNKADIAFFKFCFWDIRNHVDIQGVFKRYRETLSELRNQYPKTRFIHVTVPLMHFSTGMRDRLRRTVGATVENDLDNVKRNELNKLILEEYSGKEPVFDIATIQSILPDGTRTVASLGGKNYFYLASEYTNDGGHLNEQGRKVVAEQLLITLARIIEK